ncbi:MAG: hypothetical protein IKC14_01250, partial [Kiritimatiellae bacterium]|nr:hypothetical protein [Kiritimatiellia bacterium]
MAFAVGSASAIQTVPDSGSWRGWTASLSGDRKHWALVSPDGSERGILHGDPWGTDVSAVSVRTDGDRLAIESVETFRRWHCHTQSATDSICRRPAPIGLVSLHFDFPFVRGDKSNR